jgi:hypothetical protein
MSSDESLKAAYRRALETGSAAADHPDEATWERVICEEASIEERERVREHALRCAECADTYRALLTLRQEAAAIDPGMPITATPGAHTSPRWVYALAAGILVAAVLTPFVWQAWQREDAEPATASINRPPLSANPAFRVEKAPVLLSASLALTPRGAADDRKQFLDQFGQALAPYRADDFAEAATRLTRLSDAHPDVVEPALYAGVSLLLSQRSTEAVRYLERAKARATPEFLNEIDWQLALAYVHTNDTNRASELLKVVCDGSGPHRERGCAAVKVLADGR